MERIIVIALFCLMTSVPVSADDSSMTAHKLAETRLLAEWVGQADAQNVLGTVYYNGEGVPRDYEEAIKWYRKAAEQGHANSQYMLGVMSDRGEAVPQNYAKAVVWYRKAAEQGLVSAQYDLGNKYADGKGVPQSYADAYLWFNLSAAAGLEKAVENRDIYAGKLTREELSDAQRRAVSFFEKIQQDKSE